MAFGKKKLNGPWSDTAETVLTQAADLAIIEIMLMSEDLMKSKDKVKKTIYELTKLVATNIWRNAAFKFAEPEDELQNRYPGFGKVGNWSTHETTKFSIPIEELNKIIDKRLEEKGLIKKTVIKTEVKKPKE